ncbi:protein kinase [Haloferula sp. A504]|uniref:serine/threonine-protein kinase n=1 Tax=Haloferula sp. A504 TaxID=3373601 RepID=UPI0031C51F7B|nr:serine/threonine protein kinase [Verrucomicrobiaceae bacterium E54]
MNESDPFYERSLQRIDAFAADLYADAEAQTSTCETRDDPAPLFHALKGIPARYEGAERIGRGGAKEIFRVRDLRSTREVAMAKPLPSLGEDDFDAFLREAHITARLDHPGIVKLFDMGVDEDGRPFFTMELKKGRSLREMLREAKEGREFPLRQRLSILLRVCEAVAYAHSRRVLHLDLKPENIQIGEFGEVQVCDWGMGVVLRPPEGELEQTEVLLDPDLYGPLLRHSRGTPGYMAPELSEAGRPKSVEMDVFSLGCMLQELLTLQAPDGPELAPESGDEVLGAIVAKATRKNPVKRYSSVAGLQRDLSRYLAGYSTSVEHAGFVREVQLFYRRHRTPCLLVAGFVLLFVAGTTVFIERLERSREEAVVARQLAEQAQDLYRAQKVEAETALQNYLAATEESDRRLEEQGRLAAESVSRLTGKPFFENEAILPKMVREGHRRLDRVIALDPPPESPVWQYKFWLLFLTQDLKGALQVRSGNLDNVEDLVALAHEHAPAQTESGCLPAPAFAELLRTLAGLKDPSRNPLMERMLIYDQQFPRPDEERVAILREVLAVVNSDASEVELTFDSRDRSLVVRGAKVRVLSLRARHGCSDLSLLRFLKPVRLVLEGTGVTDLEELNGLQPVFLDLRDTDVRDLQPLTRMPSLQEVKLTPGRFTEEELSILEEREERE